MAFCIKCGKKLNKGIFCLDCFKEDNPIIDKLKSINLEFCIESKEFINSKKNSIKRKNKVKNNFIKYLKDVLIKKIKESFIINKNVLLKKIMIPDEDLKLINDFLSEKKLSKKEFLIKTILVGEIKTNEKFSFRKNYYKEEYELPIMINKIISHKFSKKNTEYFEGVFQVRNETKNKKEYFNKLIKKYPELSINKIEKKERGNDYYVSNKKIFNKIIYDLQEKFGGNIKISTKLFSRDKQKSKNIYRVTWFLEYPFFEKGDVLTDEKKLLLVIKLGKKIKYFDLIKGKIYFDKYDNKLKKIDTFDSIIIQDNPNIFVLNPTDYQPILLSNEEICKRVGKKIDENIKIVFFKNKVYFIPEINNLKKLKK